METTCILSNHRLRRLLTDEQEPRSTMHRLAAVDATPLSNVVEERGARQPECDRHRPTHGRPPVASVEVYVDDICS